MKKIQEYKVELDTEKGGTCEARFTMPPSAENLTEVFEAELEQTVADLADEDIDEDAADQLSYTERDLKYVLELIQVVDDWHLVCDKHWQNVIVAGTCIGNVRVTTVEAWDQRL